MLLTIGNVSAHGRDTHLVETINRIKPSIIAVGTYHPLSRPAVKFYGTGFVISRNGFAITAEHVISAIARNGEMGNLYAFFPDTGNSIKVSAKLISKNIKYDLSIIKLKGSGFDYLKLGDSSSVKEGQSIALCGYPYGPVFGLHPTTHTGIISNISPMVVPVQNMSLLSNRMIKALTDPYYIFQIDCTAFPGNSGGPLVLPETGEVIGVLNSAFIKITKENKQISTGISYAIPINYVRELIESIKKK
ncbi:S1C family serine protease [Candidatus Scalindua japonica]|uniref:S1C family serine protease n=1 Tax=Candidatus Scalindua japonica TaxID=1284222 RepID=UPI0013A595E9|nr:serine protease [Candidatus Scalindua japonica]